MPCPYFEPLVPLAGGFRNARLPIIDAYAGRCARAASHAEFNDFICNQGYASGACELFPGDRRNAANRYSILKRGSDELRLLFILEEEYAPARTRVLHYSIAQDRLLESDLELCVAAQALAFSRSYVKRFQAGRS